MRTISHLSGGGGIREVIRHAELFVFGNLNRQPLIRSQIPLWTPEQVKTNGGGSNQLVSYMESQSFFELRRLVIKLDRPSGGYSRNWFREFTSKTSYEFVLLNKRMFSGLLTGYESGEYAQAEVNCACGDLDHLLLDPLRSFQVNLCPEMNDYEVGHGQSVNYRVQLFGTLYNPVA